MDKLEKCSYNEYGQWRLEKAAKLSKYMNQDQHYNHVEKIVPGGKRTHDW